MSGFPTYHFSIKLEKANWMATMERYDNPDIADILNDKGKIQFNNL
ncbi:hypothetical protein KKE34_04570 [Patescibacteria group bacterium]|nr:hypothetical protein [Patescibacteria group bacterium]MBU1885850.1 hypothetical protein [Patescibacteria group bacterium]